MKVWRIFLTKKKSSIRKVFQLFCLLSFEDFGYFTFDVIELDQFWLDQWIAINFIKSLVPGTKEYVFYSSSWWLCKIDCNASCVERSIIRRWKTKFGLEPMSWFQQLISEMNWKTKGNKCLLLQIITKKYQIK